MKDIEGTSGKQDFNEKTEGVASLSTSLRAGNAGPGMFLTAVTMSRPLDIRNMTHFVFDFYVSNAAQINGQQFFFEFSSSGTCDMEEIQYAWTAKNLVDGWNTVEIPLAFFTVSVGKCDLSAVNFWRVFNMTLQLTEDTTLKLDNIRVANLDAASGLYTEEHTFTIFDKTEENYLYENTAAYNNVLRFADQNRYIIYKYTVANRLGVNSVTWSAMVGGQLHLQVSQDGKNWTNVFVYAAAEGASAGSGLPTDIYTYDLTKYVDLTKSADIYIRIGDAIVTDGWGGQIRNGCPVTLAVKYAPPTAEELDAMEAAPDAHSIQLIPTNVGFGPFKVDTENKTAGSSSLMGKIGAGFVAPKKFDPVNGTGFDSLEFDLYISDLALLDVKFANAQLELTSSGTVDKEEIAWSLEQILAGIQGDIVAGWNHVVLHMSDATPCGEEAFDISRINFFRFFMVGSDLNCDFDIGLDNIRLTDAEQVAATATDARNLAVFNKSADGLNKYMPAPEFDEADVDEWEIYIGKIKESYTRMYKAYQDLSPKAKNRVHEQYQEAYDAMIAAEKAQLSMQMAIQVRNRIISAYTEINSMAL
jgi:flagellar hook-basal body complex protein FliE